MEGLAEEDAGRASSWLGRGHDPLRLRRRLRSYQTTKPFEGVVTNLERRWRETDSDWAREEMAKYFTDIPCAACNGFRLKPEALCVKVGGLHIGEVAEMSVKHAGEWFHRTARPAQSQAERDRGAGAQGNPRPAQIPGRRRAGISHAGARIGHAVGRRKPAHPARLADRLGLTGVLYVLDEPSIGLHQRDNARLLETLKRLRDLGNT
jgi:excinuclease ABC subunit A